MAQQSQAPHLAAPLLSIPAANVVNLVQKMIFLGVAEQEAVLDGGLEVSILQAASPRGLGRPCWVCTSRRVVRGVLCAQLCGEQSFPEMSWCLSVCQHLHSSDGKRSKVWTEGCCLPASGMLAVLSVPVVSRGSKLCNLIMHRVKKYILCFMHEGFSFFFFFGLCILIF